MGRGKWGLGVAGALIAAASVGACRQTLGLDAYANGTGDASVSGLCGAMAGYLSPPAQWSECESCLTSVACSDERACATSVDCQAYAACLRSCFTPGCREQCAAIHDAGARLFAPLATAAASTGGCATECEYGQDWSCLGKVKWPLVNPATAATTDLRLVVGDSSHLPVAGATVSVCTSIDPSTGCLGPEAIGRTDGNGSVDFTLMVANLRPLREPQLLLQAAGYSDTAVSVGFPVSEPGLTLPSSLTTLSLSSTVAPPGNGSVDSGAPGGGPPLIGPPTLDAGTTAFGDLVAYVVDCEGNPATGVWATAVPAALPCAGFASAMCPTYTGTTTSTLPGIAEFLVASGPMTVTVSVIDPAAGDAGPAGPACCNPALLAEMIPGGSFTDAGIPCQFVGGPGATCIPVCSAAPGCVPPSPPLLDGGELGTFTTMVLDHGVTRIWAVPNPR